MLLNQWAVRYGVSCQALSELRRLMLADSEPPHCAGIGPEAAVQSTVRLAASRAGWRLFRNNVGAVKTDTGSWIRFGLCNDSKQLNAKVKSADLIGIKPVLITPQYVGLTIGQFVSRECKASDWKYNPNDEHVGAQIHWANIVNALGGDATITRGIL